MQRLISVLCGFMKEGFSAKVQPGTGGADQMPLVAAIRPARRPKVTVRPQAAPVDRLG